MTAPATAMSLRDQFRSGARSASDICGDALAAIEQQDDMLGAFNTVVAERARARAAVLDADRRQWADRPLAGVPVALKDNICTRGVRTTASSRMLESFVPPYDATVVMRLEAAGAIIVGKTNCDEFAMGSSTENSAFRPTRNPWALDRIPGGSSGGSAVAVASGMAPLALGSDTGGSIRQPAAHCGIVGLKPTYGRVSRYGLLAFASSLDQIGTLTWTVADAAIALSVIAGRDPADATSVAEAVPDFSLAMTGEIRGLRIGVPTILRRDNSGVDVDVATSFHNALTALAARGASLVDIDLPWASAAIPTYYLLATAEASSNLARYDGVRYGLRADANGRADLRTMYRVSRERGFGAEAKRRIMLGTYVLSAGYYEAYYRKAQQVRTLIRRDYEQAFERTDVVAMPTSPTAAFRLGERVADPIQMYLGDVFTVSANLAGLPAISIPCGFTRDELPVGLQLTGRLFDEATLLRAADAYERDVNWSAHRPPVRRTSGG